MIQRLSGDYSEGLTSASMSALLELAVTLHSYQDSIVLVGGWAPYYLIEEFGKEGFTHVGSIDIDLAVDPDKVDREAYNSIVELIVKRGYRNRTDRNDRTILFSFRKSVPSPLDHNDYDISVDFLTSATPNSGKHRHERVQSDLPARIVPGCSIAFRYNFTKKLKGILPNNGEAIENIRMLNIVGSLGMKGIVLGMAYREKDAYDIYSVISQCLDNPKEVASEVKPHLDDPDIAKGIDAIKQKFRDINAEGPSWVANFLSLDFEEQKRIKAESFVLVEEFLKELE
jgi:hypothetical protein